MTPALRIPRWSRQPAHRLWGPFVEWALLVAILAMTCCGPAWAQQRAAATDRANSAVASQLTHTAATSLLRNIMADDPEGQLEGEPITLLAALESSPDRRQQLLAVQDYWQLASAIGRYNTHLLAYRLITELESPGRTSGGRNDRRQPSGNGDEAQIQEQRNNAHKRLDEARAEVQQRQRTLAKSARRNSGQPLPLPGDAQHTSVYFTRYNEIFAGRTAPATAMLMQRLLPHYHQAVDLRTTAATAAEDAWEAVREGFASGQFDVHSAIDAWGRFVEQQQAFVTLVGQYNEAIADYALTVAPENASAADLRGMLIRTAETAATSLWRQGEPDRFDRDWDRRAEPASFDDRYDDQRQAAPEVEYDDASEADWNRAAPRRLRDEPHVRPLPPPETGPDDSYLTPADDPASLRREALRPPYDSSSRAPYHSSNGATYDRDYRVAQAPSGARAASATSTSDIYSAAAPLPLSDLADLPPHRRSQRLAVLLCSDDRQLVSTLGEPFDLQACLQKAPPQRRREAVAAYWSARRALSEWQAQRRLLGHVETLSRDRLSVRSEAGGPTLALLVEAARASARADIAWSEAQWIAAQFQLTQAVGGKLDGPWLFPTTPPHGGRYVANGRDASRAATTLQQLDRGLAAAALDVVQASEQLGGLNGQRMSRTQELQATLAAVQQEADHTRHFLDELTRYNVAIADYALAVLPEQSSAGQLVSALVVTRGGRGN